jgi:hypothetical protein
LYYSAVTKIDIGRLMALRVGHHRKMRRVCPFHAPVSEASPATPTAVLTLNCVCEVPLLRSDVKSATVPTAKPKTPKECANSGAERTVASTKLVRVLSPAVTSDDMSAIVATLK